MSAVDSRGALILVALREYVLTCQSPYGGFGKVVGAMPDLLHSFYSMAWLTLSTEDGCCDDYEDDEEEGDGEDVVYESEMRSQVRESIDKLSKLDCALGMCAKRMNTGRSKCGERIVS